MHQEGETSLEILEEHNQSLDTVRVKHINLDSIKSVLFTKIESSTNQRWTIVTYKIDSEQMMISCYSKYSKVYFQRQQCVTKNNLVILNT